ncbi:MAG TPA: hypothetical protein VF911_18265 [Thermoanaerobaculia bacterium]
MARRLAGVVPTAAAVLFVLAAYAFFGSAGTWEFRRVQWFETFYASQVEGFREGQLNLRHEADPALAKLQNPYLMAQRAGIQYPWDASYYKGKYYLYFSPVPALLFTWPFCALGRGYPSDPLTMTFFCMWAFLASIAFAHRAMRHIDGAKHVPFALWILLIGAGNLIPFSLIEVRVYEIAVGCAMAMSATWAYTLLRLLERPSWRTAAWMGLFLALTIATRPNLIVLGLIGAAAVLTIGARRMVVTTAIALAVPIFIVGGSYAVYNYQRFDSPFQTGLAYQLTTKSMLHDVPCSLCSASDFSRFMNTLMHYIFFPPKFVSTFPFADLRANDVDPSTSFPALPEQVGGIAAVTPLAMLGSALALLLLLAKRVRNPATRATMFILGGGWIVLLTLSTCTWVVARYSLDFAGLLIVGGVIAVEQGLTFLRESGVAVRPLRIAVITLAIYSVATGLLLGFTGRAQAFRRMNPERFEAIAKALK